ncbi:MAG TPA: DUF4352 domain-containing protein [Methanoregula sp.]|nr:DUF4352 domain-containing protein [Methanoregula sp.]
MMKTRCIFNSVMIVILAVCIVSTGCTSTQNNQGSVQTIPPTTATVSEPVVTTLPLATTAASSSATTIPTVVKTTTQPPVNNPISVTINSAEKRTAIGGATPQSGSVFLVLDVTLENNDKNEDFAYTNASFQILANNPGSSWHSAFVKKFNRELNNQLTTGTIPLKSKISGQIVFGVSSTSDTYKLAIFDPKGSEITRVENIHVP